MNHMWKKIVLIFIGIVALVALALGTISVSADPALPPAPGAPAYHIKLGQVIRLLSIRDQSKLEEFLDNAVTSGKLTQDQAARVEQFWVAHHGQFQKRQVVGAVLRIQDQAKLKDLLNQGMAEGKINQEQADKLTAVWEKLHSK
jgi:polyhydroxyalkanoate synthesis regulator phasin